MMGKFKFAHEDTGFMTIGRPGSALIASLAYDSISTRPIECYLSSSETVHCIDSARVFFSESKDDTQY